jgi:TolA-binding protein
MKKLKQLREDRADKLNQFEALTKAAEGRELTEQETESLATLNTEIETLDKEIKKLEGIEATNKRIASERAVGPVQDNASEVRELSKFSYRKAAKDVSRNNFKGAVEGFEKEIAEEATTRR